MFSFMINKDKQVIITIEPITTEDDLSFTKELDGLEDIDRERYRDGLMWYFNGIAAVTSKTKHFLFGSLFGDQNSITEVSLPVLKCRNKNGITDLSDKKCSIAEDLERLIKKQHSKEKIIDAMVELKAIKPENALSEKQNLNLLQ